MLLARLKKITEIVEMTLSFDSFRLVTRYIWFCLPWSRTSGPVSRPISASYHHKAIFISEWGSESANPLNGIVYENSCQ